MIQAANKTESEERAMLEHALAAGRAGRNNLLAEMKSGSRAMDFNLLRQMDRDIEMIEQELAR